MVNLTDNQKKTLKRISKEDSGRDFVRPEIAKQLIKKGLVIRCSVRPTYVRCEWNRPVKGSTLWGVVITEAGMSFLETI